MFIKYGDDLLDRGKYSSFYDLAQRDSSAPPIPAYNVPCGRGYHSIIMEKMNHSTLNACNSISEDYAVQRVASSIKWLLDQKYSVPSATFDRISDRKACVWHPFLENQQAPAPFVSSEAIAKYINEV